MSGAPRAVDAAEAVPTRDGDIQAVARCAHIMRMVTEGRAVRAADVAASLQLQRSTAHRYLASMEAAGILERLPDGSFGPGGLARHLGAAAMGRSQVLKVAGPYMLGLASESHESVVLSLWAGTGAVVTRVQDDPSSLVSVSVREGSLLPPTAAQSKIFLAHRGPEDLHRVLAGQPEDVQRDVLGQVDEVRQTGFALYSMVVRGIHTVAVPVFNSGGAVAAALALVGTSDALVAGAGSGMWQALRKAGEQISAQLGYVLSINQADD